MTTHKLAITVAMLTGLGTACGGSSNGKLSSRVTEGHLAPVSASERASEAEGQRQFFLAKWQIAFTESQIAGSKLDLDIANNELASAKLDVKNAKLELKAAEETGDQKAIAEKAQAERVAHLHVESRKVAIERAKQNKRYLEKRLVYEQRTMRSREAGVELNRADSLKSAGIKPPNFDAQRYKGQHAERVSSAKAAKGPVDSEFAKLSALDKRLQAAKNAALAAEGQPVAAPAVKTKPMGELPDVAPVDVTGGDETPESTDAEETEEPAATPKTDSTSVGEGTTKTDASGTGTQPAPKATKPSAEPKS